VCDAVGPAAVALSPLRLAADASRESKWTFNYRFSMRFDAGTSKPGAGFICPRARAWETR
jgi:hypothetical protein